MTPRPASVAWLLRHELRLAWRRWTGKALAWLVAGAAVFYVAFHLWMWSLLRMLDFAALAPIASAVAGLAIVLMFTLMLSQAILRSVDVLFDRGDLDLLLAAPVAPRRILAVRALGIACSIAVLPLLLLAPLANVGALTGHVGLLGIYPAIVSLALLAAGLGLAVTLLLVRVLGTRRARVVAQLLGAFVGAALFLATQAGHAVASERVARWWTALTSASTNGRLAPTSPLGWPAEAMQGEPLAVLALALAGAGAFAAAVALAAHAFQRGAQDAFEASRRPRTATRGVRFRTALWRVVLVKEWKLIARDPQLIAQTLLQALYLVPLVLFAPDSLDASVLVVPAIVLAAAMLASSLAWLVVAAEEAPELVAAAPVDARRIRRIKLVAALLPVWLLAAPAPFIVGAGATTTLVLVTTVFGATLASAYVQLAAAKPGERRQLRRRGRGDWPAGVLELITTTAWAALAGCLLAAPRYAAAALVAALGGPLVVWAIGRQRSAAAR